MSSPRVLAIETSCDETGVAVVSGGRRIASNQVATQIALHATTGGIVPEVAARQQLRWIVPTIHAAMAEANLDWDDLDAVAVTYGPGLIGSLLVGVNVAKALAVVHDLPLLGINHIEGHIYANWLTDAPVEDPLPAEPPFPLVCLVVSGGHTQLVLMHDHGQYRLLGQTVDDAAGEAFDKGARMLGLPYPGGPALERLAAEGDPGAYDFPIAAGVPGLDFSFAGLKTALLYKVRDLGDEAQARRADLAAAYQHAIVEALAVRVERGLRETGLQRLAIGGGVAANGPLRERMAGLGVEMHVPERALCTDNAAMIGSAARWVTPLREFADLDAYASGERGL